GHYHGSADCLSLLSGHLVQPERWAHWRATALDRRGEFSLDMGRQHLPPHSTEHRHFCGHVGSAEEYFRTRPGAAVAAGDEVETLLPRLYIDSLCGANAPDHAWLVAHLRSDVQPYQLGPETYVANQSARPG